MVLVLDGWHLKHTVMTYVSLLQLYKTLQGNVTIPGCRYSYNDDDTQELPNMFYEDYACLSSDLVALKLIYI